MLKFNTVSILGLLLLAACSVPKPEPRKDGNVESGSYFIERSSIKQTQTETHAEISLPLARNYNFEVCLRDNQLSRPIENHNFKVDILGQEKTVTSDANGCINWFEKIPFNFLAPAKWVTLSAKILAQGFHQGQRIANFAVNPWEEKAESLLTQKIENILPESQTQMALNAPSAEGLWLDDLRVVISEKTVGSQLQMEIKGQTSFIVTKFDGKKVPESIAKGEFTLDLTLLHVGSKTSILSEAKSVSAQVIGGFLAFKEPVILPISGECGLGQIELAIKMTAKATDLELKPFEAIYSNLGECDQLKGGFFAKLKTAFTASSNENNKSLQDYIQGKSLLKATGSRGVTPTANIAISVRELTPSNVGYTGSLNLKKSKSFSITACLIRPIDRKPVPFQKFKIQKVNGSSEERQTLNSGCMTWDDSIEFNLLDQECWTRKAFVISSPELNYSQKLEIDINPWDEGTSSIRDARKGEASLSCPGGKSKIVLQSYDFDLMGEGISHQIDKYLNIKLQKSGNLRLPGRLIRPTARNMQGLEDTPLPPGKYTLRWAIVDSRAKNFIKNPSAAANFIYQAQELKVDIDANGTLAQQITFESFNTQAIGNLNHILFELEPEEAHKNFLLQTFLGSILLSDRKEPGLLRNISSGKSLIKELIQQFQIDQKTMASEFSVLAKKESFVKDKKMTLVNLNNEASSHAFRVSLSAPTGWTNKDSLKEVKAFPASILSNWISHGKLPDDLAKRICSYWIYDLVGKNASSFSLALARSYMQCKDDLIHNRGKYLEIDYVYFVNSAAKLKELEPSYDLKQLANGFLMNFANDETFTKSLDVNAGFNTGKWFSPLSMGGGGRLQWAWSERKSLANGLANQSAKQLQVETLPFQMQTTSFEKCASIKVSPKIDQKWIDLIPQIAHKSFFNAFLICTGELSFEKKIFVETYAVINQILFGAHMSNPASQNSRGYFMAIRGKKEYERFMDMISAAMLIPENASTEYFAKKSLDAQFRQLFEDRNLGTPGVFIGSD